MPIFIYIEDLSFFNAMKSIEWCSESLNLKKTINLIPLHTINVFNKTQLYFVLMKTESALGHFS